MRKCVLCVPPAFVGGIWCASFSFWLGWAGLGVCLSVVLVLPSFLPSFQVPQHHSTSIIISLLRPCCAPPIGIESSCEKAMKPALLCLLLLNPDDSLFWPLSFLHFFPVALTTSDQCSFYFTFFKFFKNWSVSIENLNSRGGPAIEWQHPKKIIKKIFVVWLHTTIWNRRLANLSQLCYNSTKINK